MTRQEMSNISQQLPLKIILQLTLEFEYFNVYTLCLFRICPLKRFIKCIMFFEIHSRRINIYCGLMLSSKSRTHVSTSASPHYDGIHWHFPLLSYSAQKQISMTTFYFMIHCLQGTIKPKTLFSFDKNNNAITILF